MADAPLPNTLSADEQKFFETGELPDSMKPANPDNSNPPPNDEGEGESAEQVMARLAGNQPKEDDNQNPAPQSSVSKDMLEFLQTSLANEQRARADLEAQLRANAQKTVDNNKPAPPDANTDPIGHMMHQLSEVAGVVTSLQTKFAEQQQNQQNLQQLQNFQTSIKNLRDDFTKATPDFPKAYDHLRKVQADDMRTLGYSEPEINEALIRGEINVAQIAMRTGKNPAQVMYDMAKRHGYINTPTPNSNDQKANLEKKIKNIQEGGKTGKQPPSSAPPAGAITVEALKNASNSDLDAIVRDPKAWGQITGGSTGKDIFS